MTTMEISQSSLAQAFLAAAQAEEALAAIVGFVPQFFNTRDQVAGMTGPAFAYVRADETNNGAPTLYFWDSASLKQLTSTADISAAVSAAAAATTAAATATSEAGVATAAAAAAAGYVAGLPALVVQQVATHAALPASPVGLYLVLADETRGGSPSLYYFWSTHCVWFAALQVA